MRRGRRATVSRLSHLDGGEAFGFIQMPHYLIYSISSVLKWLSGARDLLFLPLGTQDSSFCVIKSLTAQEFSG